MWLHRQKLLAFNLGKLCRIKLWTQRGFAIQSDVSGCSEYAVTTSQHPELATRDPKTEKTICPIE
jgi:hypothetical protein